ncbi:heparinase II/III-family protein [Mesorhizobium sp. BAC0120]|uniref:heparinase II/III family protein n=1 Tax=Mesorhizobium sp. BAC0120 TaxID=3090670 RepID=UPI00298D18F9|nr:heparinase II/III-family protein [Mesorhizobium sp. BAC0120]MDW6022416.1 heparinase II/III-family protein [Mesorhizobium sp. BAC0120]
MKLSWYLNRLRNMEPAEVLHRLVEQQRKIVSRYRDGGWENYPAPELHTVFPQWRHALLAATPPQRRAIEAAAQMALQGRFSALGQEWPARAPQLLYPAEFWRFDPVTGGYWPGAEAYTFAIDFRHSHRRGDIKYVWEANRLQQLPVLAAYLVLSGDQGARAAIEAAIGSWHSANPPFRGVCWASGIEVALRAISLIVTLDLAGKSLSPDTRRQAGETLAASAYWLARFPSAFSSANNHLVAELAGEYLIGLAFGAKADGPRKALLDETMKQILADGTAAEQSPTYGAFTAELVLLCAAASNARGVPFPQHVMTARLSAFADAVDWLPRKASYGDNDEGRILTLGNERDYVFSVAAAIRGFLRQTGGMPASDDFRAILFGAPVAPMPQPVGLKTFVDGGLSVWRGEVNGRLVELMFDHGPLGYLSIAAHGHADALSLTLFVDGKPVLVDPGTWLYGSGGVWRDWFRSTPAHNTLNIEGESQSIISSKFNWSHKARAILVHTEPEPSWSLRARHDGYEGRFGVVHQRTIKHRSDDILVTDQLLGGERAAEVVFQLAAGLVTRRDDELVTVMRDDEPLLAIRFPDAAVEISAGGENPGQGGWVSPRFGHRMPAERVVWRGMLAEEGVRFGIRLIEPARGGDSGRLRTKQIQHQL